ncbi:MAG: LemA family protein [Clostridiales bacterium]|nr:LemA family protein [Clostridiales bacterium]
MKLRSGVAFLLMLCLVIAALGIGAYQGWSDERKAVEETYAGLEKMIQARVESAYNLITVASRHLPETDAPMAQLISARDILESNAGLPQKAAANELLSQSAHQILSSLSALPSVQSDSRDKMYVESYLPQMLEESQARTAGALYNTAAAAFNRELEESLSGFLARLLGVKPAEEFVSP